MHDQKNWLKIKTHSTQEAVIVGFTQGRGSRQNFGALVLGIYEEEELKYIGHTGSGFDQKKLAEIHNRLKKIVTDKMPFAKKPKTNMPVVWVDPTMVCEVKFQEWTRDGLLRHPIFLGLREDKDPKDVKRELVAVVEETVEEVEGLPAAKPVNTAGKTPRKKALQKN